MSRLILLEDGESRALLYPEHGFQIHSFEVKIGGRAVDVVHGCAGDREPLDRRYGNPILFPSVGLSHGSQPDHWDHGGRPLLMPQHGWARDLFWHLEERDGRSATGVFVPHGGMRLAFPFPLDLRARYALEGRALTLTTTLANRGDQAFPYALGFHPYLRAPLAGGAREACRVRLPSGARFRSADSWRTIDRSPVAARTIGANDPDLQSTVILGETGSVGLEVEDEKAGLAARVSVDEGANLLPFWAVWSSASDAPYLCLEPWSDLPNALNRPATRTLAPGATATTKIRIDVRKL